jgi:hypothetical protein
MQRNFDNKDFEQFLKQNADQYRMYPSEKVWKEIHNSLHSRRRWAVGIASSLLLITGAIVTWMMVLNPGTDKNIIAAHKEAITTPVLSEKRSPIKTVAPVLKITNTINSISLNKIPSILLESPIEEESPDFINDKEVTTLSNLLSRQPVSLKDDDNLIPLDNNSSDVLSKSNIPSFVVSENRAERKLLRPIVETRLVAMPIQLSTLSLSKSNPAETPQKIGFKKKLVFQLYFTPGVSYRRLTENKEVILAASGSPSSIPTNIALQDVKNVVTHKPDIGFELGLAAKYLLSNRFSIKTGLQFNVNKYDIRAFSYAGENATIAIQGDPYQQSVTRVSYYRNSSGYRPNWLTNVYFSISMPVGAELKVLNAKKIDLGFGITAQPTYLLDNRAYMISTDFKNYVKVPDLIRRWNVNTGAELILGIKSGKTRWQIGPQVRYQVLSSFKDKYPVKENLFNFGLKAGVTLNNQ